MIVTVERCKYGFRLTMPSGDREFIDYHDSHDSWWCRYYAIQALNVLEYAYGYNRRSIRFNHC